MSFWLGTAAFALTILISVSLHELGHMITGKRLGMKVTQYFVGFGPTIFSFTRGETEYGLKAIPLGGFCKIVGMTPQDEDVAPEDEPRAMWRFPVWKRTVVMSAGSITHFVLALAAIWILAMISGLPNPAYPTTDAQYPSTITVAQCSNPLGGDQAACQVGVNGAVTSPAYQAKLQTGDKITQVGTTAVSSWAELTAAIRAQTAGQVTFDYIRNGAPATTTVTLLSVDRPPTADPSGPKKPATFAGVSQGDPGVPGILHYNAASAVPASGHYAWSLVEGSFSAMKGLPKRVPALWHSISGGERDPNTPISVIGASRLGGEAIEHDAPAVFWSIFIGLNVFIGIFNLLPLLPLDGGHIAIAWYEKLRSLLYARLHKPDPGRVDYYKLMPITYAVILIGGAFTLLTATADIVNPIQIFK